MERNITEKEKSIIENLGAFEYSALMCSQILDWEIKEVELAFKNQNSGFYKMYNTGKVRAGYVIDLKLFEQAQSGDIKALEKLDMRKRARKPNLT